MLFLTVNQHQEVVRRLLALGHQGVDKTVPHPAGFEYTSLMVCFLLHNLSCADTLLRMSASFGDTWFPVTPGYAIVRTMFESDVTAHYITRNPTERAHQYISFGAVLNKKQMAACLEHSKSKAPQWRDAMTLVWQNHWVQREKDVDSKYHAVMSQFTRTDRKGKQTIVQNWSGKTLRQMATDVDHLEAYDIFYAELSSFSHVDIHLADRFLQRRSDGPVWSQKADEFDIGNVFRHCASFLTCFMELFARQFASWSEDEVLSCWKTGDSHLLQDQK